MPAYWLIHGARKAHTDWYWMYRRIAQAVFKVTQGTEVAIVDELSHHDCALLVHAR
jgi:hypothetical protein